jgi:hypothetical protein
MEKFTADNYLKGFLMDEELMAGITELNNSPGTFSAYVVRHTTGETLGSQQFTDLFEAIRTLNDIPREWAFEAISRCGGGNCGTGACAKKAGGACGKKSSSTDETSASESSSCSTGQC